MIVLRYIFIIGLLKTNFIKMFTFDYYVNDFIAAPIWVCNNFQNFLNLPLLVYKLRKMNFNPKLSQFYIYVGILVFI